MGENKTPLIAFAWASGLINYGYKLPFGALPIATSSNEQELYETVEVLARHSRTSDDLLVPGIPEAANQDEGRLALERFSRLVCASLQSAGGE
ncbi:host nuclease inhibitor protein [Salmonella enterica subsp. enterica]|nr:host nuclease inhibitor protein [Salmonella enterica subsp. enterica]EDR2888277.1 host nuclease inhibitor protein [Salmonella enterica subsp. enterica]EDR6140798.1 host nuclease inhibitor protein [Salmonella enterica subsp. enterica]EDU9860120.1 host nuclease inhibitor protein [Salmonella enterica subsp. enterica]EDV0530406.1 host nuclease inhibitor protein [Salmonella enterica subsp. enterica]